jgi:hypothetical protein
MPVEYIISSIGSVEGKMGVTSECPVTERCLQVSVGDSGRAPLDDSDGIDFLIGYETFPDDYKVWAVNSIELTEGGSGSINFFTNESSSFYKKGFLVVQLKQSGGIIPTPFEYLIIDIGTLEGTAVSFTKDWVEDGVIKFQYRDFDLIEVKQIPATN